MLMLITDPFAIAIAVVAVAGLALAATGILRQWPLWARALTSFAGFAASGLLLSATVGLHPAIAFLLAITCTIAACSVSVRIEPRSVKEQ